MNIFLSIFCLFIFSSFSQVPQPLQRAVNTIYNFYEGRELVLACQKEGPIALQWAPLGKESLQACWMGDRRVILLNSSKTWSEGEKISSILFELHNAKRDAEFIQLNKLAWNHEITKKEYVEAVEFCEYMNAKMTRSLIDHGIRLGYFPKDTYLPIYKDFAEHFKWQMDLGHSALIAAQFDELHSFG